MLRFLYRSLVVAGIGCALTSCSRNAPGTSSQTSPGAGKQTKGVIGISVLTLTNPFFKEIADSLTQEAARHGYQTLVVSGEFDVAKQQNQIKDFIVRKAAAIVLTPCDSKAIGSAIQEANAAGIPVFTADIACIAPGAKVICHIATDNYSGGKQAAEAMIEALDGKGKIAIIDHPVVESEGRVRHRTISCASASSPSAEGPNHSCSGFDDSPRCHLA